MLRRYCLDEIFESCDSVQSSQWQNGHNQNRKKGCLSEPDLPKSMYHGSRETGMGTGLKTLSEHPFCLSFADERDRVQKKTFTKWVNKHLMKVGLFHMFPKLFFFYCV